MKYQPCPDCEEEISFNSMRCNHCDYILEYNEDKHLKGDAPDFYWIIHCRNCGNVFSEGFKKGDNVTDRRNQNRPKISASLNVDDGMPTRAVVCDICGPNLAWKLECREKSPNHQRPAEYKQPGVKISDDAITRIKNIFWSLKSRSQKEREAANSETEVSFKSGEVSGFKWAITLFDNMEKSSAEHVLTEIEHELVGNDFDRI